MADDSSLEGCHKLEAPEAERGIIDELDRRLLEAIAEGSTVDEREQLAAVRRMLWWVA